MNVVLAICAIIAAVVTVLTLIYAIMSSRKQTKQLSAQTEYLSDQTELLRKQIYGEIFDTAQIRDLHFYLPAGKIHPIAVFEDIQTENEELILGEEVRISKTWETELHVRFCMDAPQRLRLITWGFADNPDHEAYPDYPTIPHYKQAFAKQTVSQFEREIYQDWHGNWTMEFPFPRFFPEGFYYTICFTVKGNSPGRFPLQFEITVDEAKNPFKKRLWIEVPS